MRQPEQYQRPLGQMAIVELVQSGFKRCSLPIVSLHQVAPNPHINIYKISAPEGELFVKHYHSGMNIAVDEYRNYQFFKALPFVPKLLYRGLPIDNDFAIFAYEYLDGQDMHEKFTRMKINGEPINISTGIQAVDQFYTMDEALRSSNFSSHEVPWALRSPVRKGFLDSSEEAEFLSDYQVILNKNQEALQLFPGFYFDRNPRNVMYTNEGMREVDYNVIEFSSPLFDLAKFLRNGTDIPLPDYINMNSLHSYKHLANFLNVYREQEEEQILQYAYDRQIKANPHARIESFEKFSLLFKYAVLHGHIFYLTKYSKMLREGKGDTRNLFSRCFYHFGMLEETLEKLQQIGEPVDKLKVWAERFVSFARAD